MKVAKLSDLSKKDYERIVRRSFGTNRYIMPIVKKIIRDVVRNGDSVIINNYQKKYGIQNLDNLQVTQTDVNTAYSQVEKTTIQALKQMIKNITLVHKAQLTRNKDTVVKTENGIKVWREWRPIEKVGLYIPGGKAVYPSSVLMSAIPAQIAGCPEIILCSPAKSDGNLPAATIVAADLIGLKKIYKVGGAEAIAAMAYGTETVPRVYKIFGAGNAYVTTAKMCVYGDVAIDMPAGPSEIFIIADETANPKYIAADLLADGEHGKDSACVLITTSCRVAEETIKEIQKQLPRLKTRTRVEESIKSYGLFALVDSLEEAISFANEYAPEHLEIMTKNPRSLVEKITNAGSVFLGKWTTKASGDYATGANHVLPTGGTAKMYPPLGVDAYGKWMQVEECTKDGLIVIKKTIETIAEVEQLPAHKNSVTVRF